MIWFAVTCAKEHCRILKTILYPTWGRVSDATTFGRPEFMFHTSTSKVLILVIYLIYKYFIDLWTSVHIIGHHITIYACRCADDCWVCFTKGPICDASIPCSHKFLRSSNFCGRSKMLVGLCTGKIGCNYILVGLCVCVCVCGHPFFGQIQHFGSITSEISLFRRKHCF